MLPGWYHRIACQSVHQAMPDWPSLWHLEGLQNLICMEKHPENVARQEVDFDFRHLGYFMIFRNVQHSLNKDILKFMTVPHISGTTAAAICWTSLRSNDNDKRSQNDIPPCFTSAPQRCFSLLSVAVLQSLDVALAGLRSIWISMISLAQRRTALFSPEVLQHGLVSNIVQTSLKTTSKNLQHWSGSPS